jgi:ParB-like chromosome segregation protein Spo0J
VAVPKTDVRLEAVPLSKIKLAKYNPRVDLRPGDPEWESLSRALRRFGYVDPVVWNRRTGNLVGGHQRLKVLASSGKLKKIIASVVDLPLAEEKALNLALNKVSGRFDDAKLLPILEDLKDSGLLEVTGFSLDEVAALAAMARPPAEFRKVDEDLPTPNKCPKCGFEF